MTRYFPAEREALDLTLGAVVHDLWRATRDELAAWAGPDADPAAAKIPRDLGFNDAADFAKYFHQRTGRTPIECRAMVRR